MKNLTNTSVLLEPEPPSASSGVIAIVQSAIFCIMGPIIVFYGPVVMRVVIVIQALFASNYVLFINAFATIDPWTLWDTFAKAIALLTGTITLSFAAIRGEKIRGVMNGAVLGILVADPLMAWLSNLLFVSWVGCTMSGPKDDDFPNGSPVGCDKESTNFLVAFHTCKALNWVIIFVFAKVGQALVAVSAAMAGATMFMKGLVDLLMLILGAINPELIPVAVTALGSVRTFVGYGLAGVGALVQFFILETKKDPKTGKKETKVKAHGKAKACNVFLKPPLNHMLWLISKLDNLIKKVMEGGPPKITPSNSLSPMAMTGALEGMGDEMLNSEAMKGLAEGAAVKAAIKAAQPVLDPTLAKVGLAFGDVDALLSREVTTLDEAKAVGSDPAGFLEKIKPELLPMVLSKGLPMVLTPPLEKEGLKYDDVTDVVSELQAELEGKSMADVITKLADPAALMEHPQIVALKAKVKDGSVTRVEFLEEGTGAPEAAGSSSIAVTDL